MSNLNFKETILLATTIYKRGFKITFALAFILSFISEFSLVYLMQHGMAEYIDSGGKTISDNFPVGNILVLIVLVIILSTIFVYAMIIILQGIMIKNEIKSSDAIKISLQIFSKKIFSFIGCFLLSMTILTVLTMFLQYIGIFITILLFLNVMPSILLENKGIFESILSNFKHIKDNFFYMFKITIVIIALMLVKPLLNFSLIYIFRNMNIEMNSLEMSMQNIIITIVDSFILPFIFAISVGVYFSTKKKTTVI